MTPSTVWVFCGPKAAFPSGVFWSKDQAQAWIVANRLSGTLTEYPVGVGTYDWAVGEGLFRPSKPEHRQPAFIQTFSCAAQAHEHYEDGQ
jgi:hypothetical protein